MLSAKPTDEQAEHVANCQQETSANSNDEEHQQYSADDYIEPAENSQHPDPSSFIKFV